MLTDRQIVIQALAAYLRYRGNKGALRQQWGMRELVLRNVGVQLRNPDNAEHQNTILMVFRRDFPAFADNLVYDREKPDVSVVEYRKDKEKRGYKPPALENTIGAEFAVIEVPHRDITADADNDGINRVWDGLRYA